MRTFSGPLEAHLAAGRESWIGEGLSFTLLNGTVLKWSIADKSFTWGSDTWVLGPLVERGLITRKLGLEAGKLVVMVYPRPTDLAGSVSLTTALVRGDFDGANLRLTRAYSATLGSSIIGVDDSAFIGKVGEVESKGMGFEIEVRDPVSDLDLPFPRNIVQAQCGNRLFDDICGLNASTYRVTGSVTGGINPSRTTIWTALAQADDYFTLGRFRWLTGANAGRSGGVRLHRNLNGAMWFSKGWPDTVTSGDTFEVWPGCNKLRSTCVSKYNNLGSFRGFPFVPAPETTT